MTELGTGWAAPGAAPGRRSVPSSAGAAASGNAPAPVGAPSGAPLDRVRSRPVPMRPMTVLEAIDGAAGAVRGLGTGFLVRSCVASAGVGLVGSFLTLLYQGWMIHLVAENTLDVSLNFGFGPTVAEPGVANNAAKFCAVAGTAFLAITVSTFTTALLSGYLARPVQRYIDGAAPEAPALAGGRAARVRSYFLLAAVATLPRLLFTALVALAGFAAADDPNGSYAGPIWLLMLVGVPVLLWLTADFAVAGPATALEGGGAGAGFGRARRLVTGGRWRTAWTAFLTLLITFVGTAPLLVCQQYLASVHGVDAMFRGVPPTAATWWWVAAYLLFGTLAQVFSVPVRACAAVVMYVDRRFRREGLDIRIAWARVARVRGVGAERGR